MSATYRVYLRDPDRRRIVEVDDVLALELVLRFNDVGAFALDVPAGGVAARTAQPGGYGLIVDRDGATVLSGPIRPHRRAWDDKRSTVTLAGFSDVVWLRDRLVLPVPSGPPYTAAEADVRTGRASTVLRAYVVAHAGPDAAAKWRVPGLVLGADPALGATGTWRGRFANLLEHCQTIATGPPEVGFDVVQADTDLVLRLYAPTDRAATAVFSPLLGTLRAFDYARQPPEANYVVVGGGGEGVDRIFVEKGDQDSIDEWGVIAQFRDRRDTSDLAELAQTADEELAQKAATTNLQMSPIDTAGLAFGTDYGLGDRVTVVVTEDAGPTDRRATALATVQDVVREVQITLDGASGVETVRPVVGSAAIQTNGISSIYQQRRKLVGRISALERR